MGSVWFSFNELYIGLYITLKRSLLIYSPSIYSLKFCRTISTKHIQPSDVRPLPVLEDTLNYLLNLLDSCEHSFEVLHEFIFDRMRSIRQDLSMQNIISIQAVHMYERMVCILVVVDTINILVKNILLRCYALNNYIYDRICVSSNLYLRLLVYF